MHPKDSFVAINVGGPDPPQGTASKFSVRGFYRLWRGLTHLQKKLAIALITALLLWIIISFSSPSSTSSQASNSVEAPVKKSMDQQQKSKKVGQAKEEELDFNIDIPRQLDQMDVEQDRQLVEIEQRVGHDLDLLQQPKKRPKPKLIVRDKDKDIDPNKFTSTKKVTTLPPTTTTVREPDPPPPFKQLGRGMAANERQSKVAEMFRHAWKSYRQYAWGHDHLKPISRTYDDWFGVGLTLLDSIDTMYLMDLKEEYLEARDWIARKLNFDKNTDVNLFECTIRVLGSMLSAFHITGDQLYKEKAMDIGHRLMPAMMKSRSPVPYSDVNLHTGVAHDPRWGPDSTISEVTSIQLEFRDLSHLTNNDTYKEAVDRISNHVARTRGKKDGLVPMWINANTGLFRPGSTITVGARADSYYEYLLKQWIQSGQTEEVLLDRYLEAISAIKKHLVGHSKPNNFAYVGELLSGHTSSPKMDHLVCFLPGTLALGATKFNRTHSKEAVEHMELGEDLLRTCYEMYRSTATGLTPEITYFNTKNLVGEKDLIIKPLDRHNLLRPETVESLFYMWRITKNEKYREWGWNILQAFEKHTKVASGGYTSINNVLDESNVQPKDKMESFFLGETLKYLYLLFSDDDTLMSIDSWVFNTEAHPLPIYT